MVKRNILLNPVIEFIKSFDVKMEVGPFETTIEGDYETLMDIVKECPRICTEAGAEEAMLYVKINYAPAGVLTMEEKCTKHRKN